MSARLPCDGILKRKENTKYYAQVYAAAKRATSPKENTEQ